MLKQLFLPIIGVAIFIALVGVIIKNPKILDNFFTKNALISDSQKIVQINDIKIEVISADTEEKRQKGLSEIKSLKEKEGMLFIFDKKNIRPIFWMKDMLMDIDIIWINDDKIVQIDKNVKAPSLGTPDSKLERLKTSIEIDYVLEVNAGFCDKNNIKVNDQTKFDL